MIPPTFTTIHTNSNFPLGGTRRAGRHHGELVESGLWKNIEHTRGCNTGGYSRFEDMLIRETSCHHTCWKRVETKRIQESSERKELTSAIYFFNFTSFFLFALFAYYTHLVFLYTPSSRLWTACFLLFLTCSTKHSRIILILHIYFWMVETFLWSCTNCDDRGRKWVLGQGAERSIASISWKGIGGMGWDCVCLLEMCIENLGQSIYRLIK